MSGKATSPYKKMKTTNCGWVPYINIKLMKNNKLYKMVGLTETNHPQFGAGQQATIETCKKERYRTQMPGKYLANLSAEDIKTIKTDVVSGRNPYLVYRETLPDNSYRIDIIEKSPEVDKLFAEDGNMPELEESVEDTSLEGEKDTVEKNVDDEIEAGNKQKDNSE